MNPHQLPINQPVIITSNADFSVTATRLDSDWMETAWRDQRTGDQTLRVRHRIDGATSQLEYLDLAWWNVTINGRPATQADMEDIQRKSAINFKAEPAKREITISVSSVSGNSTPTS